MSDRYSTTQVSALFTDEAILDAWVRIEREVARAQSQAGLLHPARADLIGRTPAPTPDHWHACTRDVGHEVVGFLAAWQVPTGAHVGLTSSDLVDTGLAMRLSSLNAHLRWEVRLTRHALAQRARLTMRLPAVARTHGQPAAPDTVGHWLADLAHGYDRVLARLVGVRRDLEVANLSGPTGAYITPALTPAIAAHAADQLGLRLAACTSQIVLRDSLAQWAGVMAQICSLGEAMGNQIRAACRDGHGAEWHPHQREGSSAMPHKNNPTDSERLAGLGRLARAALAPLTEGIAQWDAHDLAHSSVERELIGRLAGYAAFSLLQVRRQAEGAMLLGNPARVSNSHALLTRLQLGGMGYFAARRQAQAEPNTDLEPGTPDLSGVARSIEDWSSTI